MRAKSFSSIMKKPTWLLFYLLIGWHIHGGHAGAQPSGDRLIAQETPGSSETTDSASQPTYRSGDVYLPSSRAYVRVGKTGFGHEHGVVGSLKSGRILLDREQDAGELVFDMASFRADTNAARKAVKLAGGTAANTQKQVTATMLGASVLNAAKYPEAKFKIDSALRLPDGGDRGDGYALKGQLTIHETTRPLQVSANVSEQNGWLRVRGKFDLKQSDFGITPYSKAFGGGRGHRHADRVGRFLGGAQFGRGFVRR